MTHTPFILDKSVNNFCNKDLDNKLFTPPFSECDVLQLQELFVTCGIHTIKVRNVDDGRFIIQTILDSLNYYHNIGCITNKSGLATTVYDIINTIEFNKNSGNNNQATDLESFFSIYSCFDFIWVELTKSVQSMYSSEDIKKIFTMYHAQERMPVLIITYDQE